MMNLFILYSLFFAQLSSSILIDNFECNSTQSCYDLANELQIDGTKESYAASNALLYNSIIEWPNNAYLWELYGKLNLFYSLSWQYAFKCINKSLLLDSSYNNNKIYLYSGWLYSTPSFLDKTLANYYFKKAINLTIENNDTISNFWPYFEYGAFLSHIMNKYNESKYYYDIADNLSPNNPFINFFYGLLLKYHLNETKIGQEKIQSAINIGPYLPGQAAGNLIFQSILFKSNKKYFEYEECCDFSANIINPKLSGADIYCLNDTYLYIDNDNEDNSNDCGRNSSRNGLIICLFLFFLCAFCVNRF